MKQHRSTRYHFQIVIYLRGINRDNLNTFKINPVHLDFVAFSKYGKDICDLHWLVYGCIH